MVGVEARGGDAGPSTTPSLCEGSGRDDSSLPDRVGGGVEFVTEFGLEGFEEGLGGPAVAHEEIFEASAGAILAELLLFAEDFGGGDDDGEGLVLADEGGDADGYVGLGGEAAADAEGVANFLRVLRAQMSVLSWPRAGYGGEADVVDLGVGAPEGAAGDGDLEFAGEVVEVGVGGEGVGDLDGEG